eukprot:2390810-Lingulodinium_polyedra.AAC.1
MLALGLVERDVPERVGKVEDEELDVLAVGHVRSQREAILHRVRDPREDNAVGLARARAQRRPIS